MNIEFPIIKGKDIVFEYKNNKEPYRSEIKEKIVLIGDKIQKTFLIIVKRHHENYYKIFNKIEKGRIYSLEIIFYMNGKTSSQNFIEIDNKKIETPEILEKTKRYNLINVNLNNSIQLYNKYADNKINIKNNIHNEAFKEPNLCYNFLYNDKKKIGKIFQIKEDKELDEFNKEEKEIINKVNNFIKSEIFSHNFANDFQDFYDEYSYDIRENKGNKLKDLNDKFIKIPFFLKYYDKNPTNTDFEIVKVLCILNIFIDCDSEEKIDSIISFNNYTENIFTQYKKYLSNKDKIMILLNYLTAIKNIKNGDYNYRFKLFYEMNEDSSYIRSELLYRDIISKLTKDSNLFFLYLQLNSGSEIDYMTGKSFYKIKHISLIELKAHLLTEYFYPYFFVYGGNIETFAWNSNNAQVKNYNLCIFSHRDNLDKKFYVSDTVKLTLLKLYEYGHNKFKGNNSLQFSPRYLYNNNLEYNDNIKLIKKEIRYGNILINDFIGESGKAVELYIFENEKISDNILISHSKDLSKLYNVNLFIQKDFLHLNQIIKELDLKIEENNDKYLFSQQSKKGNFSIPKLEINIKEKRKDNIFYYYDLGINSIDLEGRII